MDAEAFRRDGAIRVANLLDASDVARLLALAGNGPGARLNDPRLPHLIEPATRLARALIGQAACPVRAVLFDKTPDANWAVA